MQPVRDMRKVQFRAFIWLGDEKTVDQIDKDFLEKILLYLLFYVHILLMTLLTLAERYSGKKEPLSTKG